MIAIPVDDPNRRTMVSSFCSTVLSGDNRPFVLRFTTVLTVNAYQYNNSGPCPPLHDSFFLGRRLFAPGLCAEKRYLQSKHKMKTAGGSGLSGRKVFVSQDTLGGLVVEEPLELAGADRVLQLADRLGFDLADAFAGDLEDPPDFLERVGVTVADAVAELDDFPLAV